MKKRNKEDILTLGPWIRIGGDDGKVFAIVPAMRPGDICLVGSVGTQADMTLISAAPDLLKALEALYRDLNKGKITKESVELAYRAINHARY